MYPTVLKFKRVVMDQGKYNSRGKAVKSEIEGINSNKNEVQHPNAVGGNISPAVNVMLYTDLLPLFFLHICTHLSELYSAQITIA